MGDFWGFHEEYPSYDEKQGLSNGKGVSCILVNTNQGKATLEQCEGQFVLMTSDFEKVARHNDQLHSPSKYSPKREQILELYQKEGYEAVDRYFHKNYKKDILKYTVSGMLPKGLKRNIKKIDSILAQKNVEVTIRVRDDGSTDGTIRILEEYQKCGKLNWYSSTNMGPAKSFLDLVYNAPLKYDYYAFCDQDDYWKEDKLYKAIERLEHFDDKPALYHCELEIVDENLEHIKMTRNCNKTKFIDQTLMVFYIPGCTMVFNNCLMRKIQERKPEFDLITMHDCWLYYICLGIGGKIISDKNAYIQYRQHGNNVIGAKRISIRKKIQMICQQNGSPRAKMIDEIIRLYGQDMKKEMLSKYKTFASYPKSIKAKNYFFKQSTENVFSTRELQKAKLRILFGSL